MPFARTKTSRQLEIQNRILPHDIIEENECEWSSESSEASDAEVNMNNNLNSIVVHPSNRPPTITRAQQRADPSTRRGPVHHPDVYSVGVIVQKAYFSKKPEKDTS